MEKHFLFKLLWGIKVQRKEAIITVLATEQYFLLFIFGVPELIEEGIHTTIFAI